MNELKFKEELKLRDEQIDILFRVIERLIDEIDYERRNIPKNQILHNCLSKGLNISKDLKRRLGLSEERFL